MSFCQGRPSSIIFTIVKFINRNLTMYQEKGKNNSKEAGKGPYFFMSRTNVSPGVPGVQMSDEHDGSFEEVSPHDGVKDVDNCFAGSH